MILKKFNILIICFVLFSINAKSQKVFKLEDAIAIGLENNFDIRLGKIDYSIAKTNNTNGNAGMNPNVNFSLSSNYSLYNTHLEYSNGNSADNSANGTFTLASAVQLNWTIFDGFKMFVTKDKLDQIEKLGEIDYQSSVQNAVAKISNAYYDIIRQKQILKNIQEIKALAKERMTINETRFESGLSAKTDLLQAKIDYNTHQQNELIQENAINEAKKNLLEIIVSKEFNFDVSENFEFEQIDTTNNFSDNNLQLKMLKRKIEISKLAQKEIEAQNMPQFSINTGYLINYMQTATGSLINNFASGPIIGATLNYPIYSGGNISRQIEIANLNYQIATIDYESLKSRLSKEFSIAVEKYLLQKDLLRIEENNAIYAKENLHLSIERLKLQQTTSLEVRDAQLMYENSLTRFSNFSYNVKVLETQIKLLTGKLK